MNGLSWTLIIVVFLWIIIFEAIMVYFCYQTYNMICDIREYLARGRGKK